MASPSRSSAQGISAGEGRGAWPFSPDELLTRGLTVLGLPSAALIPLLNTYMKELELFNSVFDLVGADTRSDLVVRHILDSLSPWRQIAALADTVFANGNQECRLADVGTGAGLPGIPLAAAFPNLQVTLIERMSKRCAFLENCVAVMGLKNVTVLNCEAEKAPRGTFDIVVFRAFRPLDPAMTKTLSVLAAPGGRLAAWKARQEKIREEMSGIESLIAGWESHAVPVPFLEAEERNLVIISPKQ